MPPLEIQVLQPSITQLVPSRRARVVMAATSEPASGSDNAKAAIAIALGDPRQVAAAQFVAAAERDRAAAEALHRESEVGERVVVAERLAQQADRSRIERVEGAAPGTRHAVAQQPASPSQRDAMRVQALSTSAKAGAAVCPLRLAREFPRRGSKNGNSMHDAR